MVSIPSVSFVLLPLLSFTTTLLLLLAVLTVFLIIYILRLGVGLVWSGLVGLVWLFVV